jgi:hypothetical protein
VSRTQLSRARRAVWRLRNRLAQWVAPAQPQVDHRRLVRSPVFVYSSVRSGSTLLRAVLDSHTRICAPHEMHMAMVRLETSFNTDISLRALDLTKRDLENLLWDRVLHLQLAKSGKSIIVDKTPRNTREWKRVRKAWPRARYIFLLRHPLRVAESLVTARPDVDTTKHYEAVVRYAVALRDAMANLEGHVVRYEDFTAEPERVTRELCRFLGVEFEPAMLSYNEFDHGGFRRTLGDWSEKIKSGVITPAPPNPPLDEVPEALREACVMLGYA